MAGKARRMTGRIIALLAAMAMCLGLMTVNAQASETAYPVRNIDVPVEDGVYYADVELWQSNRDQASMGNAALRGSSSYKAKQTADTYDKAIIIVKDGKATAIVEFMPMGYLGTYGFMMELESVQVGGLTQYGGVNDTESTFTPAQVLARHLTQDGKTVYDPFNDPDSASVFNGNKTRPAGFGHTEERTVDIADEPYSHILALDVTPIQRGNKDGTFDAAPASASEYTWENGAYVHVFVPVMFSISTSSGDQYARMKVDWTGLEAVENPQDNVYYSLYMAGQISRGSYTEASYNALQTAISDVTTKLENVWPSQDITMTGSDAQAQPVLEQKEYTDEEKAVMAQSINDAIDALEQIGDKAGLETLLNEAAAKAQAQYTESSYAALKTAMDAAQAVIDNDDAGVSAIQEAAEALSNAMAALVLKDADYTAVDAALLKVPSDLTGYTDETVAALNTATGAVIRGLDITRQADVDAMASAIESAVSGLVAKTEEVLDKNNLADGIYSVDISMVKMNRTDLSMSNDAVSHTAKLEVKDGNYTFYLNFKGLSYLNRFGYLAKLSYYEDGYTYGQYGGVNGTLAAATVVSTQKNADGTDVTDEFNSSGGVYEGQLYPETVSFPLVATALADADGFVPLHVFVPVMEDISTGTGDQDVLMKVDWSTLKATSDDDPAFEPEGVTEQSPAVDLTDAATGVKIHADQGVFDEGVQLVVTEITSGTSYNNAATALSDVGAKFKAWEIHFVDKSGNTVQPNGMVTVYYPIPSGYNSSSLALYRINDGSTKTLIKGDVDGSYYVATQKSFSTYALVEKGSTASTSVNSSGSTKTGDDANITIWIVLAAACAGGVVLTVGVRRRMKKKN